MATTKTILVTDDDPHIREVISFALEKANMQVVTANDGYQALEQCQQHAIDLLILDINMPEMDGLECCRELRKTSELPILFLSSRDEEIDRILGLELGGDDYVTKPFSPRELVARVNAILKRSKSASTHTDNPANSEPENNHQYQVGLISLNTEQYTVTWQDKPITLTGTEFAILALLMRYPQKVFSRDAILNGAYESHVYVSDRTIDSHIRRIRSKFADVGCEAVIDTQHGIGYKLTPSHTN